MIIKLLEINESYIEVSNMVFMILKLMGDNSNMLKEVIDIMMLLFKNIDFFYGNKDPGDLFWVALF